MGSGASSIAGGRIKGVNGSTARALARVGAYVGGGGVGSVVSIIYVLLENFQPERYTLVQIEAQTTQILQAMTRDLGKNPTRYAREQWAKAHPEVFKPIPKPGP